MIFSSPQTDLVGSAALSRPPPHFAQTATRPSSFRSTFFFCLRISFRSTENNLLPIMDLTTTEFSFSFILESGIPESGRGP
jgi:hypothetical protein